MTKPTAALVYCTFPDEETAKKVSHAMVEEKLVACANILPKIESVFEWDGGCAEAQEAAVLFKTAADRLDMLIARLGESHPYDTPAIVGWRCDAAHPATLHWLNQTVG